MILWDGPTEVFQHLLNSLNGKYPTIEFTAEFGGKEIGFLDLKISILQHKHSFGIHRKPSSTDIIINNSSYRPTVHKLAAFHSLIHRLVTIPLTDEELQKQVSIIHHLASVNGFTNMDIDRMVRKKFLKKSLDTTTALSRTRQQREKTKWMRMPFLGEISNQREKLLKPYNLRPAFYPISTSRTLLCKLKDPVPKIEKSGVYSLPCNDCNAVYIGETGRQFQIRVHEHLDAKPQDSAFTKNLEEERHSYKKGSGRLLHVEASHRRRLAFETLESARHAINGCEVLNYSCPSHGIMRLLFPLPPPQD